MTTKRSKTLTPVMCAVITMLAYHTVPVRAAEAKPAVTVHNGVATLTGKVGGWTDLYEAQRDARKGGASAIINQLEIKKDARF